MHGPVVEKVVYVDNNGDIEDSPSDSGGRLTFFKSSQGNETIVTELPPGFDPAGVDDVKLKRLGIPPRPTGESALAIWTAMYRPLTRKLDFKVAASFCETRRSNTLNSPAWSGRLNGPTSTTGYKQITGSFQLPTYSSNCAHASSHATWAGIGGNVSYTASGYQSSVMQAGIDTSQSSLNAVFPFFEIAPLQTEQVPSTPAISPGDSVSIYATWGAQSGSQRTAYFAILNDSHGTRWDGQETVPNSDYDGSSAQWIDERPSSTALSYPVDGAYYYYYRKATNTLWWNEQADQDWTTYHWAGWFSSNSTDMVRPNGNLLASGSNTSVSNHTDTWKSCA